MTLDQFRARFPILGRRVYVNSCSQGALSLEVAAALQAFVESWHAGGSPWDRWIDEVERLRSAVAASIGAAADEIAVMPSASTAIAAVATALPFDTTRRRVVLGDFEFPTMAHGWLAQERRGAVIAGVPARGDLLALDDYAARIDDATAIVPAAHVCFRNGCRLDIGGLAALCRERGALCMIDDYQHTGTAPLDVHALGVDVLVTGSLKYLLGPSGIAFLYVRRPLIERLEPLTTGWFGRIDPFAFALGPLDWATTARRFEAGSPPVPNAYAAAAGLDLLQRVGASVVEAQVARLTARMIDGARARGFAVATPADPAMRGPLVVVRATDAAALAARLAARGIIASARGTGLRVSFHAYNDDGDVDAVLAALEAEAGLVVRADAS
ncbi:MAG: aminotransferase class V-fold PLP-dependent enzyme [Vicinamibacterales bacterium]